MAAFFRLLALSLLFHLSSHALAGNSIGKDDLDAQKELLLLKMDGSKELLQKDIEAQGKRLDAIDKRIDDQVSRVSDIGNAVDRFGVITAWITTLITILLAGGGFVGYWSVAKKAKEEAKEASKKWFSDNHKELNEQIQVLQNAVTEALQKIDHSVADFEVRKHSAMESLQKDISAGVTNNPEISPADAEGLRASDKQLKGKPEASYSFNDWNTRAFAAYQAKQFEEAALFWKYAAEVPNAGATNTAQVLFNRAVTLSNLNRNEEAITTYSQIIDTYCADATPAIREQVAKAMLYKTIIHREMGDTNKNIATCDQLIETYRSDPTPAIREQVATAMNERGFTYLLMTKAALANQNVTEANELLHKAITDLQAAIERKPEWGMALGNLAYVQWLLELPAEAEATFRTALLSKDHGDKDLYQATLDDIAQHPIPEDTGFREMIDRLWAEYQARKTS